MPASNSEGWEEAALPDPEGVARRIAELGNGLSVDVLLDAVRVGQQAGAFCTAATPVYGAGQLVHIETNTQLRSSLMLRAWTLDNEMNVPRIVSSNGTLILTAITGNHLTGLPMTANGATAQPRAPRGSGGRRLIRRNTQGVLEGMLPVDDPELRDSPSAGAMWYLLYHRVAESDIVRSELSLAESVTDSGALIGWYERLPLPEIDLLNGPTPEDRDHDDDVDPDVDVPVHRLVG